ncbi:hypothetical protein QLQ80_00315 [Mycoplasma sp. M5725]|uniref:Lipoprotein n=1 Tax=Mycoplasma phocimorsus TaxID=3045839 RepID=A0AAJ1UWK1_9MOLU|nr:hypothetical protein [Mycoplasma phocimorsus]MDJ1645535.1 hypothetical protein [Mycoplasma phocimorsus]
MFKKNKLTLLFSIVIGLSTTVVSCNSNINKKEVQKEISKKLINQEKNKFKFNNKQDLIFGLIKDNQELNNFPTIDSNLVEKNNFENIKEEKEKKSDINTILKTKNIFTTWKKKAKQTLRKKELEAANKKKNAYIIAGSTISALLVAGSVIGAGIYLFKYNRDPLHKTKAYFTDLAFKTYLKYKNIDVDFKDSFKNLIFYLYKENDQENKKLIDFLLGKAKEVIFDKKNINSIINKEEIKKWAKNFGENEKSNIKNNPILYFIEILGGSEGKNFLEEFLKFLKIMFNEKEKLKNISGFSSINYFFEKQENVEGILSSITSIFAGSSTVKNGVEFIITNGKDFLDEEKKGLLTVWIQFIDALRKIINKNGFKTQYKNELETLYNLFYNVIKQIFEDKDLNITSQNNEGILGFLSSIISNFVTKTFKITNIITPNTIKEWIENKDNKISDS